MKSEFFCLLFFYFEYEIEFQVSQVWCQILIRLQVFWVETYVEHASVFRICYRPTLVTSE